MYCDEVKFDEDNKRPHIDYGNDSIDMDALEYGSAERPLAELYYVPITGDMHGEPIMVAEDDHFHIGDFDIDEVNMVMRKNHMELLNHQRDDTMHKGIRTKKHSLNNCVSCHAKKDDKGQYIAINAEKQFCQSCHTYAGVSIDCFQCHATKPAKKIHHHSLTNPQAIPQGDDVKTSQLLNNLVTH